MGSDNPSGADDQQETNGTLLELDPLWIVGFVDGEGCFSVSIHRNANARSTGGWQLHPTFHVYQHERHRDVLEQLVVTFGCGRLRPKGPNSRVLTFAVDALHRHHGGFERLVRLAYAMNAAGKQRSRTIEQILEGSSETARQAPIR